MADYVWGWARDIIMGIVSVLVFFWGRDRKQANDAIDARFRALVNEMTAEFQLRDQTLTQYRKDIDELVRRLEDAGEKSSHLASIVQGNIGRIDRLPEELRKIFMSLERGVDLMEESRRDRQALWDIINRLAGTKRNG